jgi:hypothetical protein
MREMHTLATLTRAESPPAASARPAMRLAADSVDGSVAT